jgi:hypothetical protein
MYAILEGRTVKPVSDVITWGKWLEANLDMRQDADNE